MEEKRKFIRLNANVRVNYKVLRKRREKETLSKDISGGGIRLFLNEKLPPATLLKLEIKLPTYPELISAEGVVVWVEKIGIKLKQEFSTGIKFTKIGSVDRARIFNYVYERIY